MYRVILVDDEQLILAGLSKVVRWADFGCEVVGTARDGREGLALIRRERPDIVISDIRMPNMDGLTMLAALRSEFPQMQLSVLTAYRDFDYAQRAINLGVCRYLLKPSKMDELNEAIRTMTDRIGGRTEERDAAPAEAETAQEAGEAGSFIVNAALEYMRAHCTERISLAGVADNVYVSQWHLSKLINRHTGQNFLELLNMMRIERAKVLLADPSLRIHAIAEQVGYNDVAHFSKSFKKITGRNPGEFRASLGEGK
ncbi:MAG: response regulator [Clostridia bacterium]|nr:response regulator [Clostridia bacterium]